MELELKETKTIDLPQPSQPDNPMQRQNHFETEQHGKILIAPPTTVVAESAKQDPSSINVLVHSHSSTLVDHQQTATDNRYPAVDGDDNSITLSQVPLQENQPNKFYQTNSASDKDDEDDTLKETDNNGIRNDRAAGNESVSSGVVEVNTAKTTVPSDDGARTNLGDEQQRTTLNSEEKSQEKPEKENELVSAEEGKEEDESNSVKSVNTTTTEVAIYGSSSNIRSPSSIGGYNSDVSTSKMTDKQNTNNNHYGDPLKSPVANNGGIIDNGGNGPNTERSGTGLSSTSSSESTVTTSRSDRVDSLTSLISQSPASGRSGGGGGGPKETRPSSRVSNLSYSSQIGMNEV